MIEYDEVRFRWGPWDGHTMRVWPDQLDVVVVAAPPAYRGGDRVLSEVPRYPVPDRDYGRYVRSHVSPDGLGLADPLVFRWAGYVPRTPPAAPGASGAPTDTGEAP